MTDDAPVDPQPSRRHLYVAFSARKQGQFVFGWSVTTTDDWVIRSGKEIEELSSTIEKIFGYDENSVVIINFMRMEEPLTDEQKPMIVTHVPPPPIKPPPSAVPAFAGPQFVTQPPAPDATATSYEPPPAYPWDGPPVVQDDVSGPMVTSIEPKPKVDLLRLCATIVELLHDLCAEMRYSTPSHSWRDMPKIRDKIEQLRDELRELTK